MIIVFDSLYLSSVADKLKTLFILFAGHMTDNMVAMLDDLNTSKTSTFVMFSALLVTLSVQALFVS